MSITVQKLNESFSIIDADSETMIAINEFLKVERPDAYFDPLVKSGFKSPYDYFTSVQHGKLLVMNGHLSLLGAYGIQPDSKITDFIETDIDDYLVEVKKILPYPPYDYQEFAFKDALLRTGGLCKSCTSSGKSFIISLLIEFFRRKGKKGLLLVPNINLLTQFKADIKDYNLIDLWEDTHVIGGGETDRHFDNALTISTWQSLQEGVTSKILTEHEVKNSVKILPTKNTRFKNP
jgi:hypothetical protein